MPGSDNTVVPMLVHWKQSEDYEEGSEPVEGHWYRTGPLVFRLALNSEFNC